MNPYSDCTPGGDWGSDAGIGAGSDEDLLLHVDTLIGQVDDELCHVSVSRPAAA